jgi:hypothetical protein
MTYSTQTKESSEQKNTSVQQKATGVLVNDNRPSTAAALQRQEKMATSPVHSAQRALIQKMADKQMPMQRAEDEQLLQGKFATVQRAEDEELLQGKFETTQLMDEEELLQGKFEPAQRAEDEELLQGKFASAPTAQLEEKPNNTGLPNQLKAGIESLSGMSMDNVKVHYNSSQPAQLNAHAYAQGTDIHVAPGQEQHLPHEAWHVVQQAQGRVKPTLQMKEGVPVNDDVGLETEADVMGAKALGVAQSAAKKIDGDSSVSPLAVGQFKSYVQGAIQLKCPLCRPEDDSVQRYVSTSSVTIQKKGSVSECEAYYAGYKAKKPQKCTQNNTKAEMEVNVIATQEHIDGRQQYITEECDTVLPGSIAKGSDVALASHVSELDSVKRSLETCNDKIARGKYKNV